MHRETSITKAFKTQLPVIMSSTGWMLLFSLGVSLLTTLIAFLSGLASLFIGEITSLEDLQININFGLLTASISTLLTILFARIPLDTQGVFLTFKKLGFRKLSLKPFVVTLCCTIIFYAFEFFLLRCGTFEEPAFMTNIISQINSNFDVAKLFFTICILVPFAEEILFRGIAFQILKEQGAGVLMSIVVPSVVFTFVHFQYQQVEVFILIFTSSILLGILRVGFNNLWYCILAHSILNTLALSSSL